MLMLIRRYVSRCLSYIFGSLSLNYVTIQGHLYKPDKIEFSSRFTNFLLNNKSKTDHPPPCVQWIEEKFERTVLPPADTFQMNERMYQNDERQKEKITTMN